MTENPHRDGKDWRLVAMAPPMPHCVCGAIAYVRCLLDHTDRCFGCFAMHVHDEEIAKGRPPLLSAEDNGKQRTETFTRRPATSPRTTVR